MTDIHDRTIQHIHLQTIYQRYTNHIFRLTQHIQQRILDGTMNENTKTTFNHQLDLLIKTMSDEYNQQFNTIYEGSTTEHSQPLMQNQIFCERMNNVLDQWQVMNHEPEYGPFMAIRATLLELVTKYGVRRLSDFIRIYYHDHYESFVDPNITFMLKALNKVFVPTRIEIIEPLKTSWQITPCVTSTELNMDIYCNVYVRCTTQSFCFHGYVRSNNINLHTKTALVCAPFLYQKYCDAQRKAINQYRVSPLFMKQYLRHFDESFLFVYETDKLAEIIRSDFHEYSVLITSSTDAILQKFSEADIKQMHRMINLLLLGNQNHMNLATLLYGWTKQSKFNGHRTYGDIIYDRLSFHAQSKLRKQNIKFKAEIKHVKTLNKKDISYEKRLAALPHMPTDIKSYVMDKIKEIKMTENNYKAIMAIEGLLNFPWKPQAFENAFDTLKTSRTQTMNYLAHAQSTIESMVYGHAESKKTFQELLGKWIMNSKSCGQIIGLVGPPGVGKTLLAKSIGKALDLPVSIIGVGGMYDSADLVGHSYTYSGAQYGSIIRNMIKAGQWRSVMVFDEVDKVSHRHGINEIQNILIHLTDPNMNTHFQDRFYSSIDFDLSGLLIIFSYNDSSKLDQILKDRIREIKIQAYSTEEKIVITQTHLLKELCDHVNFDVNMIEFSKPMIQYLIETYTQEAGVRELKRKLEQILLKLNLSRIHFEGPFAEILKQQQLEHPHQTEAEQEAFQNALYKFENQTYKIKMTKDLIHQYLDQGDIEWDKIHTHHRVGVINGLYATSMGLGGIVPIQMSLSSGQRTGLTLKITGNQKKIMRESIECAKTVALNLLSEAKRQQLLSESHIIHVHAPDGATPKDGPSAGCAFTTAFVSLFTHKKINRHVAMTGEIDLTGKICKIGGLSAKLEGARRAGIKHVYVSQENQKDVNEYIIKNPTHVNDQFQITTVKHIRSIVLNEHILLHVNAEDFQIHHS